MKKIISNCTLLAAALSAKYRTYNDFQPSLEDDDTAATSSSTWTTGTRRGPLRFAASTSLSSSSSSLEEFLDENGILVTMCMRLHGLVPKWECSEPSQSSSSSISTSSTTSSGKVSASWIQANKTGGFRVVQPPVDVGPPVGFILKPTAFSIQCIYPMDADTDRRDDLGCGPNSRDARYGSKGYDHETSWYRKSLMRFQIEQYKSQQFGIHRTWSSISCADFFQPISGHDVTTMAHVISHNNTNNNRNISHGSTRNDSTTIDSWEYLSELEYLLDQWSHTMRHDVCNTSVPVGPASFDKTQTFIYMGPNSWQPKEWNQMISLMEDAIRKHPLVGTWNELVLQVPSHSLLSNSNNKNDATHVRTSTRPSSSALLQTTIGPEMVQAVFYIQTGDTRQDQAARQIAQTQAQAFQKPLFHVLLDPPKNNQSHLDYHDKNPEGDIFHCVEPTVSPRLSVSLRRSNVRPMESKYDWEAILLPEKQEKAIHQ
jgi:hypothetical protein